MIQNLNQEEMNDEEYETEKKIGKKIVDNEIKKEEYEEREYEEEEDENEYLYNEDIKPPFSYASLIAQAINSTREKRMTLSCIYTWITNAYPFYRAKDNGWQNSIRHNLSLNKCFIKIPRTENEPGKGAFWGLEPKSKELFENGVFKKRRSRSGDSGPSSVFSEANRENALKRRRFSQQITSPPKRLRRFSVPEPALTRKSSISISTSDSSENLSSSYSEQGSTSSAESEPSSPSSPLSPSPSFNDMSSSLLKNDPNSLRSPKAKMAVRAEFLRPLPEEKCETDKKLDLQKKSKVSWNFLANSKAIDLGDLDWSGNSTTSNEELFFVKECADLVDYSGVRTSFNLALGVQSEGLADFDWHTIVA